MAETFYDPKLSSSPQIQTEQIKVFSNNNQTYLEKQKIIIQIPKEVQFIDPANTYLQAKVDFNNDAAGTELNTPVILNATGGLNSLFSRCTIYAGDQLLEDITGYDYYCSHINAYCDSAGDCNRDSLLSGKQPCPYEPSKQISHNIFLQPYTELNAAVNVNYNKKSLQQNLSTHLKTGLFSSHKVYFNSAAALRIELTINPTDKSVKMVDMVKLGNGVCLLQAAVAANATTFTLQADLANGTSPAEVVFRNSPFAVGDVVSCTSGGNTDTATITNVAIANGRYVYTINAAFGNIKAVNSEVFIANANCNANLQLKDVSLSVAKVIPPKNWVDRTLQMISSPGGYNFDIDSINSVIVSKSRNENDVVCYVPTIANRAKSCIVVPINSAGVNTFTNDFMNATYDNIRGDSYSFYYESGQHPSEEVFINRYAGNKLQAEHLYELEKALSTNNEVKRLDYSIPQLATRNKQYFMIGRQFTPVGSMSLNSRDLQFRLKCRPGQSLQNQTTFHFYIHNIRRVKIDLSGTRVIM